MKLIEATYLDKQRLYEGSAWTWEGTTTDKASLEFIKHRLNTPASAMEI